MFEWDEAKNRRNIEKHGISFATASRIFEGPILSATDTRQDYGETRQLNLGRIDGRVVLLVVHTDRAGKIRIISARRANYRERQAYENAFR